MGALGEIAARLCCAALRCARARACRPPLPRVAARRPRARSGASAPSVRALACSHARCTRAGLGVRPPSCTLVILFHSSSSSLAVVGLLSFMVEDEPAAGTIYEPSEKTPAVRRRLAAASRAFNLKNADFCRLFPEEAKAPPPAPGSAAAPAVAAASSSSGSGSGSGSGAAAAAAAGAGGAAAPLTAAEADAVAFFAEVLGDSPPGEAGGKRARRDPSPADRSVRARGGGAGR